MKTASKIKILLIIFLLIIASVIIGRHFVGLHFKKKFSKIPPPGIIITTVEKSNFFKSIETFGTAIAINSKIYRVKKDEIVGNFNIDGRFVKKGEIIAALKDNENVVAEFSGKLGKREIAQGVLGSDSYIITLDNLNKIVIDIKIPENFIGMLKPGLKAEISSTAFSKTFKGKVESVSSRVDPSTRSILARVIVNNSKYEIIPGQLLTVKIIYNQTREIGIPEKAIIIQGNSAFVYIVDKNVAKKRNIKIGKRNFGKVSVTEGLQIGEKVVSEGISKVRNNSKVSIINTN